jgi:hypothetical protein
VTATADLSALHPARRPELRLSGPLHRGPAVIHLVRDPLYDRTYELGPKEHFVLDRLDGVATLGEIGAAYALRFGARLGDAHWTRLLGLLGTRRLLAGAPAPPPSTPDRPKSTLLDGRASLVPDAPGLMDRLHRATAPLLRPLPLAVATVAVVAMLAMMVADADRLLAGTGTLYHHQPVTVAAVGTILWLSLAVHELAHGLAGRAFGGSVSEIGLRWRLPVVFTYCTVDDVQFLPRRRQQVITAAAGAFANLLFLLPFAVVWLLLPERAQARPAIAGLLVLGVAIAAANLVPLPPLDGYKMIGYGCGISRLATGSRVFLLLLASKAVGRGPGIGSYPRRLRWIYGGYGLFVVAAAAALVAVVVVVGSRWLADRWGGAAGVVPAALLAALLVLWAGGSLARRKRVAT